MFRQQEALIQAHQKYRPFFRVRFPSQLFCPRAFILRNTNTNPPNANRTQKLNHFRLAIAPLQMVL